MSEKELKEKEVLLLNLQLIISGLVVLIGILSFLITYNFKLQVKGEEGYFTAEEVRSLAMFAKIMSLIAASIAVYISFQSLKIAKTKGEKINDVYFEIGASLLTFVAAILLIIVVYRNNSEFIDVIDVEL